MLSIGSIVIRVDNLERQLAFWQAALGYEPRHEPVDDFVILQPPGGDGTCISLDRVPAPIQIPPRLHLDLYTDEQDAEVQRLLGLGATRVEWSKRPADADYVILADPEGNRFCVVDTAGTGNSPSRAEHLSACTPLPPGIPSQAANHKRKASHAEAGRRGRSGP